MAPAQMVGVKWVMGLLEGLGVELVVVAAGIA